MVAVLRTNWQAVGPIGASGKSLAADLNWPPFRNHLCTVNGLDLYLVLGASRWEGPTPRVGTLTVRLFLLNPYRHCVRLLFGADIGPL